MAGLAAYLVPDPELARSSDDDVLRQYEGRGFHCPEMMAAATRGWGRACLGEVEAGIA